MYITDPHWNVLVTCGVLGYVLILIALCERGVSRSIISPSLSRKIIHIGAASWLVFWPLYSDGDGAGHSWMLNILVPAAKGAQLLLKGAVIRDPTDKDVRSMSRSGDPTELLYGPLQFTVCMSCVGALLFRTTEACLVMGALGVGDGIAPLVGTRYGAHRFRAPGGVKSVEGSVAVACGTVVGYYLYGLAIAASPRLPFGVVLGAGVVAALVEAVAPANVDNIAIPIAMHVFYRCVA